MKKFYVFLLLFISSHFLFGQSKSAPKSPGKDETEIRNAMNAQIESWNKGDIEGFMQTYWNSDSTLFVSKKEVTHGWKQVLKNYKTSFADTVAMGKLEFDLLEVKRLSAIYYHVVGKWKLTRSVGDLEGHFTLLFRKIHNKWLIVIDHTS